MSETKISVQPEITSCTPDLYKAIYCSIYLFPFLLYTLSKPLFKSLGEHQQKITVTMNIDNTYWRLEGFCSKKQ